LSCDQGQKKEEEERKHSKVSYKISGTKQKFIIIIFMELACEDGRYFFGGLCCQNCPVCFDS
jgi:hypothetical protein